MADLIIETTALFFACVAIVAFLWEMHGRRKLHERELQFNTQRWNLETEHIGAQVARFEKFVEPIAERLKDKLTGDPEWIADALRRSEFFPYESTIFGRRAEHYKEEKTFIAERFSEILMDRLESLAQEKGSICLVIDSGTTLYPFFENLVRGALVTKSDGLWIAKTEIITNNLPGVFSSMKVARAVSRIGAPTIPIKCTSVAGELLTSAVSITGQDSESSLERLIRDRKAHGAYVISLVTGNWIRLRRSKPECPLPIARGHHLQFKQIAMSLSDETYVISPLAKILVGAKPDVLPLISTDGKKYDDVDTESKRYPISVRNLRLVTSCRMDTKSLLYPFGLHVRDWLHPTGEQPSSKSTADLNIYIPFDLPSADRDTQKAIEFPYAYTRCQEFYNLFRIGNM